MVECKYRGRVIGWLVTGADGFLEYFSINVGWMPETIYFRMKGGP